MKKKSFISILLRNLAISVVVALVICCISGIIAFKWLLINFEKNIKENQQNLIQFYQNMYLFSKRTNPFGTDEQLLNNTYDYMDINVGYTVKDWYIENTFPSASIIYNVNNCEKVAQSTESYYVEIRKLDTSYREILFCHETMIPEISKIYSENSSLRNEGIQVVDYYIIDGKKYFGKIKWRDDYFGKEYFADFTPASIEGATHVELDWTKYDNQYYGYLAYNNGAEENSLNYLYDYVNSEIWFDTHISDYRYKVHGWNISALSTSEFVLPDGTVLRQFQLNNTNLNTYYGKIIWTYVAAVVFTTILCGSVIAYIQYIKLKARYKMDEYRRMLTDSIAHDLKSPLMAISGYAENIMINTDADRKDHYAESIIYNVQYMNGIISNALKLSKLENGKINISKQEVDLYALTSSLIKKYDELLETKHMKVIINGGLLVLGDEILLGQAIDNLVNNSIKYAEGKSEINIFISEEKKIFKVSNICKIDEIIKEGIGLSISKAIFELHGYKQDVMYDKEKFVVTVKM